MLIGDEKALRRLLGLFYTPILWVNVLQLIIQQYI